jgi:N-acetylmuramoyl-L-alanine amidase
MTTLYLAIGHGRTPDGKNDPGAVHGKLIEHDLARQVVEAAVHALHRSGFHDFIAETSQPGWYDDVDYRGSVIRANAAGAQVVCEVHFNAGSASAHGTETLFYPSSEGGRTLASFVQGYLNAAAGIDNRGVKPRADLWLLRGTHGVAIIPEVAFVDGDAAEIASHPRLCMNAGEALARGLLRYLGKPYVRPDAAKFSITSPGGARDVSGLPNLDTALATAKHYLLTGTTEVTITHLVN